MSYLINHDGLNQFCWLPSLLCGRLNALRKGATVRTTVRLLLRHLKNSSVLFVIHGKKCFDLTILYFLPKEGRGLFFSCFFGLIGCNRKDLWDMVLSGSGRRLKSSNKKVP